MDLTFNMDAFEEDVSGPRLDPRMSNDHFDQFHGLHTRIGDYQGIIEYKTEINAPIEEQLEYINKMESSIRETLQQLMDVKIPLVKMSRKYTEDITADKKRIDQLTRELARLTAEINAQRKMDQERDWLEEALKGAPWAKDSLPHQYTGAYRMTAAKRAILGDKPGLGKTRQSIMTADMLRALGQSKKVLVFCPKPVLDSFERHFRQLSEGRIIQVLNHKGKGLDQSLKSAVLQMIKVLPECVLLTNYEVWRKEKKLIDDLIGCQFDTVILDEAHTLKDYNAGVTKGIRSIVRAENQCPQCGAYTARANLCTVCGYTPSELFEFRSVKNLFPMTGTVILNHPLDLFPLVNLLDEIAFPDENSFLWDYCKSYYNADGQKRWKFKDGGSEELLAKLGLRFTARDRDSAGVIMPPQEVVHHNVETDEDRYAEYVNAMEKLREDGVLAFNDREFAGLQVVEWYTRMRQMTVWPDGVTLNRRDPSTGEVLDRIQVEIGVSPIMDEAEKVLKDALDSGDRVIVFCKFKQPLKEMSLRLTRDGVPHVRYDGDLGDKDRIIVQHDFNPRLTPKGKHKFEVALCQYDSAKQGLDLDGAQQVIFLDREWNPSMEEQAKDRVRRIGSKDDTIVHMFHCEGTATELLDALHEEKGAMLHGFESVDMKSVMKKFLGLGDE